MSTKDLLNDINIELRKVVKGVNFNSASDVRRHRHMKFNPDSPVSEFTIPTIKFDLDSKHIHLKFEDFVGDITIKVSDDLEGFSHFIDYLEYTYHKISKDYNE